MCVHSVYKMPRTLEDIQRVNHEFKVVKRDLLPARARGPAICFPLYYYIIPLPVSKDWLKGMNFYYQATYAITYLAGLITCGNYNPVLIKILISK